MMQGICQVIGQDSVVGIAAGYGCTFWGSNPIRSKIFCTHLDWPLGPPSLLYNWHCEIPRGKAAGVQR
jgi:hypothetical protein